MKKIVLVQTAFLGDLLLSLPLIQQIKKDHPDCHLTLVCRKGLGSLFEKLSLVDQVLEIQKGQRQSYKHALEKLGPENIDLVLSPHTSFRTTLFCFAIKATQKVSFRKIWNFWAYSKLETWNGQWPEALRQLSLWRSFNSELDRHLKSKSLIRLSTEKNESLKLSDIPDWSSMDISSHVQLWSEKNLKSEYKTQLTVSARRVLIFPGSVWATKKWFAEGYCLLAAFLQKKGLQVIWMGGSGEETLAEDLCRRVPGSVSYAGKTSLLETMSIMLQSDLVVGNDSASSHLSAACRVPVVSIFGPTVLKFGYRPWSNDSYIIEKEGLDCRPCGKHGAKKCPRGTHECMTHISPEEVIKQVSFLLNLDPSH